jgi:hypothetical protein
MGKSRWDDGACSSDDDDYSDMQVDTTWGPSDEKDRVAISSDKLLPSLRSGEEGDCSGSHEGQSEPSKEAVKGKYKCSVCGVMHLKRSLLKQHMLSHSDDG